MVGPCLSMSAQYRGFHVNTDKSYTNDAFRMNATTAHIISPALGSNFAMYMAKMEAHGSGKNPGAGVERFFMVLKGRVYIAADHGLPQRKVSLQVGDFMYLPPNISHTIQSELPSDLLVFERIYTVNGVIPTFQYGSIDKQPILDTPGEVFKLRKLLPDTFDYDFNVHVMDFMPGEHLNVREVHYNQHGLLLLHGKGIYRLGDEWMPVTRGDAIWMAPFCVQWFAALGTEPARYILYKDTTIDPLHG